MIELFQLMMYTVNKKLNFNYNLEDSYEISSLDDNSCLKENLQFELENYSDNVTMLDFDNFSPCHTRSGRVYESIEKKKQ